MLLAELGKALVVSPHLDDAVFSCGELIAQCPGTVVVTVFAGAPAQPERKTDWDAASGFRDAGAAIAARRTEDRAALTLLSAQPLWLEFCDSQYHATPTAAALEAALHGVIADLEPAAILLPAGLFHSDHLLVYQAMLRIRPRLPEKTWLMYEEALYRCVPGLLQQRLAQLARDNIEATPLTFGGDGAQCKRRAVYCYASQLRALQATVRDGYADAFAAERYWRFATDPTNNTRPAESAT